MDNQASSVQNVDSRSLRTRITLYDVMDYVTAEYPPKFIRGMLNILKIIEVLVESLFRSCD